MQDKEPWIVAKRLSEDAQAQRRIDNCLHICLQLTANLAILINPFLPFTAKKMIHMMKVVDKMLDWENAGKSKLLSVGYSLRAPELLFRKIENEDQLVKYHEKIPVEYIVQDLIEMPVEVSVFYYRHPAEKKGTVSGFIHKELLQVAGDGKLTLRQLIEKHPRAKYRMEEMEHRHGHRFERIIPEAEVFYLSYAGNHNRGAHFTNLYNEIDEDLLNVFDELSHYTDKFFYGRYDIKTTSIEDLKKGKNFWILEFNGCGAEPNHIYDCGMSIWQAYKVILQHWKALYQISRYNHKNGTPYWSFKRGWDYLKDSRRHFKMLEKYD